LAPGNYITSHNVKYELKERYKRSDTDAPEREYPSFVLRGGEVFLNHEFTDGKEKTVLMGFKWTDEKTGRTWMQDRAGWLKRAGKGWVIYLQPGHAVSDLESPVYSQIVLNAFDAKLK
jgi:type 1 glutamine amidotransferase